MEFGGKITINCPETKVSSSLTFQTKSFYGGKPHQVTAEIKAGNGNTTGRLSGDWLVGIFELSWLNGQVAESIDLSASDVGWLEKKVRPIARQRDDESMKLWYPVRRALAAGDFQAAADHKKMVKLFTYSISIKIYDLKLNASFRLRNVKGKKSVNALARE
jgi:hypothetical protein